VKDRYGFEISTALAQARDAYVTAVDLSLSANHGAEQMFRRAIALDEGLAVAHVGLARTLHVFAQADAAKAAARRARELAAPLPHRQRSHVAALATNIEAGSVAGFAAAREHLNSYPRDAMVLAPCTGVFGLIGFSGRPGREAELLAFLDPFAGVYGDDWWFGTAHAFAQVEVGEIERALHTVERALAQYPRNAHGAHIRAHVYYEAGERVAGLAFLSDWWRDYPKPSLLHGHLSWHIALWHLALGDRARAWAVYQAHLHPGASSGPPINTLSDAASFLFRAELAGEARRSELWRELSAYATRWFASPGIAFADTHAALAHAVAGNGEALAVLVDCAKGPAAGVVAPLARAFRAFCGEDWATAARELERVLASHERIGGSRAQRDLIEYALVACLLRTGRGADARRLLAARRPRSGADGYPIEGVSAPIAAPAGRQLGG
jgi:tetratricopeptide (TPR) repeat protein